MFIDEFLDLFKNQIPLEDLKYKIPYREAIMLRDIRVDRLQKEREKTGGMDLRAIEDELS